MRHLIETILEKHANAWADAAKKYNPVDWAKRQSAKYNAIKNSPSFKVKKMLGTAALVSAPVVYGLHSMSKSPDTVEESQVPRSAPTPSSQY